MINQLVKTRPPEFRAAADTVANIVRSLLLAPGRPFYSDLSRMTDSIEWVVSSSDNPLVAGWAYVFSHAVPNGTPAQAAELIKALFPCIGFSAEEIEQAVKWVTDAEHETLDAQIFFDADARWLLLQPAVVATLAKKLSTELSREAFSQWIDVHFMGKAIFFSNDMKEHELAASSSLSILREVAL